jgi:hypothetical protein
MPDTEQVARLKQALRDGSEILQQLRDELAKPEPDAATLLRWIQDQESWRAGVVALTQGG